MKEQLKQQAQEIFNKFCSYLKKAEWHFDSLSNEEGHIINLSIQGDDFPVNHIIRVYEDIGILYLLSPLPFKMEKEKLLDGAVAINIINNKLVSGNFDYNVEDGAIVFRLTTCWRDSDIGDAVFEYMLISTQLIVDKYNDKLFMLSKGKLSLKEFVKEIDKDD